MVNIIKFLLKRPRIYKYLRKVYDEALHSSAELIDTAVLESIPLDCREIGFDNPSTLRLNLLVPALSQQNVFGGIATALALFDSLRKSYQNARIILTDEQNFCHADNPAYVDWIIQSLDDKEIEGLTIVSAGDRYGKTLSVGPRDRFIATAWWTASLAKSIQNWQYISYSLPTIPPYIYLIQDFEPGFYPWSSRYILAEATYSNPGNTTIIFNTTILKKFFENEGYNFDHTYVFEPCLNERLLAMRSQAMKQVRRKRILVYGRPSIERNAFAVIIMALCVWTANSSESIDWEFISVGESHAEIDLSNGKKLISKGKLSLEEYAFEMGKSSLGISLMISPHPSYPPLEMVSFGMKVITNQYKNKNLSEFSTNIISLTSVSPETIVQELIKQTQSFTREPNPCYEESSRIEKYISSDNSFESLTKSLLENII